MTIKHTAVLLACLAVMAGCGKNIKSAKLTADPYERLAEDISAAHGRLSNKKIAILPFSYTDKRVSSDGEIISERLLTRISNGGKLEVIERSLLEKVMSELKLQHSGSIDGNSIKGLGRILGAASVVTGTLTPRRDGRVEINARLINTETAAVISAATELVLPDWEASAPAAQPRSRPVPLTAARTGRNPVFTRADPSNCPDGMVAYWNFDSGPASPARDVFGGSDATLNGPALTVDGVVNYALDFKTGNYMKIGDCSRMKVAGSMTMEAWIKYRTIDFSNSGARILCVGGSYCFLVGGASNHNSNLAVSLVGLAQPNIFHGNSRLEPGTWYHVAVTYDGSMVKLYLNGAPDASFPASGRIDTGVNRAYVGWDPEAVGGYQAPLDGIIDELAVYSRPLSQKEITAHYNSGGQGKGYCGI